MVIEDDQDLRDSLQRLLQEKYTISMAANGEEGLKLVQEIKPDLILSDVMMPIMDGFELCKQLKRKKETSCIPIILLTAKINDKDYLEGLNCGADAYITKPFNFNVLQANIDMVISNRKRGL
ncbi:MAG: response regulator [Parabacteroides merdae]